MSKHYNNDFDIKEENKNKRGKKALWIVIFILLLLLFTISALIIVFNFITPKDEFDKYKNDVSSVAEVDLPDNPINFDAIQQDYPDVCAWIQVDGTIIDYPILQSAMNALEDFYLNHNIDGKRSSTGAIYIQKYNRNTFTDPNTVIYGHNMLNGTMFGTLKRFRAQEFFDQNRYMYVYTPGHILKYEIMSAFAYDDRHILNAFNFQIEEEYRAFLDECINPSSFTRQVWEESVPDTDDRIITLSTCTSNDSERYLVIGLLISDTKTK